MDTERSGSLLSIVNCSDFAVLPLHFCRFYLQCSLHASSHIISLCKGNLKCGLDNCNDINNAEHFHPAADCCFTPESKHTYFFLKSAETFLKYSKVDKRHSCLKNPCEYRRVLI